MDLGPWLREKPRCASRRLERPGILIVAASSLRLPRSSPWHLRTRIRGQSVPTASILRAAAAFVHGLFRSRLSLQIEILALRHQLAVYQRTCGRPRRTFRGLRHFLSIARLHQAPRGASARRRAAWLADKHVELANVVEPCATVHCAEIKARGANRNQHLLLFAI